MALSLPVANLVGNLAGGVLGMFGQKSANTANAQIAQKNRDFQERMSSTAHQREVKDLRAAGLNPILSAGGSGASTPAGSTAVMQNEKTSLGTAVSKMIPAMVEIMNTQATTANTLAKTTTENQRPGQISAATAETTARTALLGQQLKTETKNTIKRAAEVEFQKLMNRTKLPEAMRADFEAGLYNEISNMVSNGELNFAAMSIPQIYAAVSKATAIVSTGLIARYKAGKKPKVKVREGMKSKSGYYHEKTYME